MGAAYAGGMSAQEIRERAEMLLANRRAEELMTPGAEDSEGRRYWIYREGLFGDGRGDAPEWYIHGLFG